MKQLSYNSSSDSDSEDEGRNIDTNVIEIGFDILKNTDNIQMGDPIICEKCQAVFNKYSKILSAQ